MDSHQGIGAVLAVLIFVVGIRNLIKQRAVAASKTPQALGHAALLANTDYHWPDTLQASGGSLLFDPKGFLGIATKEAPPRVIPFVDVTEWGFDPLINILGDRQLGYRFRIQTHEPLNPITWIEMRGANETVPRFWMAKLNAYLKA